MTYEERVMEKLQEIRESIKKVQDNIPKTFQEFSKMGIGKDGIYKNIEFAIESIIDICSMLVKEFELGIPGEDMDILRELEENKILSKEVVKKVIEMHGFRNFLVHRYGKLDDKIAYNDIKRGLKDFEFILKEIEKAINRK